MNPHTSTIDRLHIAVYPDRPSMGAAAARHVEQLMLEALSGQHEIRVVFAAAPSQDEFLAALSQSTTIPWTRVVGLHMDEYVGLAPDDHRSFASYLTGHLFSRVAMRAVHLIGSATSGADAACRQYDRLLAAAPIDIVCMGIGENGHIAFNDPPVADFQDPFRIKIVDLDEPCRQQQVNDGCFESLADVPRQAITLTVPTLMSARHLSIVVPNARKAAAVAAALRGPITTAVPASILRTHPNARLFLDPPAAEKAHL